VTERIGILRATLAASVVGVVLLLASPAFAHAGLESSDPADGELLQSPPATIEMVFTEPPDADLSDVEVFATSGQQVQTTPAEAGDAARSLVVGLPGDLADGVYTVSWRVVSSADGHPTAGVFAFGVGVQPGTAATPGVTVEAAPGPSPYAVAGKIALYVGIVLGVGLAVAGSWVMPGELPRRRACSLVVGCSAVAGATVMLLAEADTLGATVVSVLTSSTGHAYIVLLAAASVLLVCSVWSAVSTGRAGLIAMGLAAGGVAVARATGGHAAAADPAWPQEAAQSIHMIAVGVWIGGFVPVLMLLRERRRAAAPGPIDEVKRFSRAAGWAVLIVVMTGIVREIGEAGGIGGLRTLLLDTSYGTALIVKVAIVIVLIGLGAFNRIRSIPRFATQEGLLTRVLSAEAVGAVAILAVTALLTSLNPQPPPAPVPAAPARISATGSDFATTMTVTLTATPGTPGPNGFRVEVDDFDTGAPLVADAVTLRLEPVGRPQVTASALDLTEAEPGTWTGRGTQLSLAGVWDADVRVQAGATGTDIPLTLVTAVPGGQRISVSKGEGLPDIVTMTLAGGVQLQSYIDPGTAGSNDVHVTAFDAQGDELPLRDLLVVVAPEGGSPRALEAERLTPGHFSSPAELSQGAWRVDIVATGKDGTVLQSSFDQTIGQETS
jgi:copper transport protein